MADLSTNISISLLNANGINIPINRQIGRATLKT